MKKIALSLLVTGLVLSTQADARRHHGDWVAPLVGGAIVGAVIANQAQSRPREEVIYREVPVYREERYDRYDYRDAKRRCAARYRSYDWRSETYVGYDGRVRSCP